MDLVVSSEVRPGVVDVRVFGERDMSSSPELPHHVEGLHLCPGASLVVDLSGVPFVDSSGLSSLVAVRQAVMDIDGRLGLVVGDRTMKLLRMTHLDSVFALYDTVAVAVDDLAGAC